MAVIRSRKMGADSEEFARSHQAAKKSSKRQFAATAAHVGYHTIASASSGGIQKQKGPLLAQRPLACIESFATNVA
jgi:hypothetical protein